ncbi:hypothetical protein L2E82_14693 [Cichorium intybus]|uniref:Uncharacterized protein n=1 Tax=Cichorium intybus TaxID=13427 RepID=A0ACB9F1Z2_CICIN|nr:hypothetical protein L2E82_14693 [Cichorium intybus]
MKAVQRIRSKGSDEGGGDEGVCQSRGSRSVVLCCCTRKKQIGGASLLYEKEADRRCYVDVRERSRSAGLGCRKL